MYSILDLFSGIGGFSLGLHRASDKFYTTAFCEIEDFCQAVLKKNFKNIHIFKDVKELNEKTLKAAGAVKPFIITGGYPCQPFSVAGKRKGKDDPRNIWSEMFRLIKELKPVWVLAENVEGHIKLGLDKVLYDLESQNYTTQTFIIPATGVGANHQRKRLWIIGFNVSNSKSKRSLWSNKSKSNFNEQQRLDINKERIRSKIRSNSTRCSEQTRTWWQTQSELCGVPNGVSYELDKDRTNRIKSLGNSIVPQIAEIIGKAIITQEEE
jgi:DNA (cytosine-5)-methyltransferase 1